MTINKNNLLKALSFCKNKKILIIGDIMLDEYHWGKVSRISPEAPVPVCTVEKTTLVPGGAANVAYNIAALGSEPILFGVLGQDSSGEKLINVLNKKNIQTQYLIKSDEKPTILKSRIVAHQQHIVRVDREDSSCISEETEKRLKDQLLQHIQDCHGIILSDYLKGTLTDSLSQFVIKEANKQGKKIIIDPKGQDYIKYQGATLLTPNFSEFQSVTSRPVRSEEMILEEGLKLIEKLSLNALVVTRSEKGMSILTEKGEKLDISTQAKDVFDITGAGDSVIGMITIALASECSLIDACHLANFAAGNVVAKIGTATTSLDEIQASIKDGF